MIKISKNNFIYIMRNYYIYLLNNIKFKHHKNETINLFSNDLNIYIIILLKSKYREKIYKNIINFFII